MSTHHGRGKAPAPGSIRRGGFALARGTVRCLPYLNGHMNAPVQVGQSCLRACLRLRECRAVDNERLLFGRDNTRPFHAHVPHAGRVG